MLGAAGEIVTKEEAPMLARCVAHLPDAHVLVPDRNSLPAFEGEAEQAVRGVKGGLDDSLKPKIRFDRGLLDVAARLAQLFRVVAPVPRGHGEILSFLLHQRL